VEGGEGMKCRKCSQTAVIHLPQHNVAYCEEHFNEYFLGRVQKTIKTYSMTEEGQKVLVAVSGGKDSVSLWHALAKLKYKCDALFLSTGMGTPKLEQLDQMAKSIGSNFIVYDAHEDLMGLDIPKIAKILRRPTCSVCGSVRRYLMNKFAVENGYDVLATGHNLDDEVSFLLGNLLNWQTGYLARQSPTLPKTEKFVKKIKPLVLLTEKETYAYALINNLPFSEEKCPFSKNASSLLYKRVLNEIEVVQPGTKLRFYAGAQEFFKEKEPVQLRECIVCGYPTTEEVCSFCKMRERLKNALGKQAV
jgi:uncharacterized protein (TIGR00269 family)